MAEENFLKSQTASILKLHPELIPEPHVEDLDKVFLYAVRYGMRFEGQGFVNIENSLMNHWHEFSQRTKKQINYEITRQLKKSSITKRRGAIESFLRFSKKCFL